MAVTIAIPFTDGHTALTMNFTTELDSATMDSTTPGTTTTNTTYKLHEDVIATPELPPKIIKECVHVILNRTLNKILQECCNGCKVDHPSQRQHPCLF